MMAGGRKKANRTSGPTLKFKPPTDVGTKGTGTRPLAEPSSIGSVLGMMVVHCARKILYGIETSQKVGMYVMGILLLSVLSDFTPSASHYMARQDNVFNQYFVKFGWGWTLFITGAFVCVTSFTYSCGNIGVIKNQLTRLFIATGVWYGLTGAFLMVEEVSGVCNATKLLNKAECLASGYKWRGFDISGHCFLLVWNSLFMIEEGKAYLGWERIKEMIRNEEHRRLSTDLTQSPPDTVLSRLSLDEYLHLRKNYNKYTTDVRILFCLMAVLVLLWDVMLVCTALYFHIMIEKVIACLAAVILWFVLYRGIYIHSWSPGLPGEGPFKYVTDRVKQEGLQRREHQCKKTPDSRWTPKEDVPKFMGMPLYALNKAESEKS